MNVIEFCERYKGKNDNEKYTYANSVIKRKYVPYIEKMTLCKMMAEKSLATSDKGVSYLDMATNKLNFTATIIALYTTLEYTKNDKGIPETAKGYDALRESGAIDSILECIGSDIEELLSVNQSCLDTVYNERCSTEAFVGKQFEKIGFIFSAFTEEVLKQIGEELKNIDGEKIVDIMGKLGK